MKTTTRLLITAVLAAIIAIVTVSCDMGPGSTWVDNNNDGFDDNTHLTAGGSEYNEAGFNWQGFDSEGYNTNGYNEAGWNRDGFYYGTGNLPYDTNGNKEDGTTWRDDDGYDWQGFDVDGFDSNDLDADGYDRDGFRDGYNRQGFDANGWDVEGRRLNEAGQLVPYDTNGLDINGVKWVDPVTGLDYQGLDSNGFKGISPISTPSLPNISSANSQYSATRATNDAVSALRMNALTVAAQLRGSNGDGFYRGENALTIKDYIVSNSTKMADIFNDRGRSGGDDARIGLWLVGANLIAISNFLPEAQQERFMLLMDAYRTKAYFDARKISDNQWVQTRTELNQLLIELDIADITAYVHNTVIPALSAELGINPGLLGTVLNQVRGMEQFWAQIDDIRAMGLKNTYQESQNYDGSLTAREMDLVHGQITTVREDNLPPNAELTLAMGGKFNIPSP